MSMPIDSSDEPSRRPLCRFVGMFALLGWLASMTAAADSAVPPPGAAEETELRATGMTFVGNRNDSSELVVKSAFAIFHPERDLADLESVHAIVTDDSGETNFEMTCERASLNVETNDFRAEGDVRGSTADGQRYTAPWVEYDHAAGLLHTDAPIRMVDGTGTFTSDGFRYRVRDHTFKMLGNVAVEQNQ
jgi:LPS export ABC transporter protein LptC